MSDQDTLAARLLYDRDVSAETLEEWTAQVAAPKPGQDTRRSSALLLRAGGQWLALPTSCVQAALPLGPVHSVPFLGSAAFAGLANVDGELLPCVRLCALLGAQPEDKPDRPRLIAVSLPSGRYALLVDHAAGTSAYDPQALQPAPVTLERTPGNFIAAMAELDGVRAGLADTDRLSAALMRSLRP